MMAHMCWMVIITHRQKLIKKIHLTEASVLDGIKILVKKDGIKEIYNLYFVYI